MSTFQTILIIVSGYLVSRLILRAGAHEVLVAWLVRRAGGSVARIVLGVMVGSFALSMFIPNALTVLALIPVVTRIRALGDAGEQDFGTLLAMGLIYGGNLGGVGSLVGSPANIFLLVNLELFQLPHRLSFVSWLVFGLPLGLLLVLVLWGQLLLVEGRTMKGRVSVADLRTERGPLYSWAVRWSVAWLGVWVVLLLLTGVVDWAPLIRLMAGRLPLSVVDLAGLLFSCALTVALFAIPHPTAHGAQRLLQPRDLVRDLPVKGLIFGTATLVLLFWVAQSGAVPYLQKLLPRVIPASLGPFVATIGLCWVTIYATGVLSNTTVAAVVFPISIAVARHVGLDPALLMLGVALASTCAFMTPIATPVNALAFAGIGGVSLGKFVKNGAVANALAGALVAMALLWFVGPVLGLFG
jgi:sodium-dependent dicarboxylate transporter 2/3/5